MRAVGSGTPCRADWAIGQVTCVVGTLSQIFIVSFLLTRRSYFWLNNRERALC